MGFDRNLYGCGVHGQMWQPGVVDRPRSPLAMRHQFGDGSLDITAKDLVTGELIYIEVERETNKDAEFRVQKWQSLHAASNGNIRVICDKASFMRKLTSEINFALSALHFATSAIWKKLNRLWLQKATFGSWSAGEVFSTR
jgi:hypothetical protein